jgi:LEA14-like dessication related protein
MLFKLRHTTTMLAIAAVAAGCGTVVKEPEVRISGVRLGAIGLDGGLLHVRLTLENPNGFAVEARRLIYHLELAEPGATNGGPAWSDLAGDTLQRDFAIPGRDSVTVELPVRFSYRGVGSALRSLISTGTFDYRVQGSLALEKPIRREIPFRRLGTMTLTGSI